MSKYSINIVGLLSLITLRVIATPTYETNTGDRPADLILLAKSKIDKEKDAKKQRENESEERKFYRRQKHL